MGGQPYYFAYEERYRKVFAAGIERWGHSPDDKELVLGLTAWVDENGLRGKKVIEFACGEGASGEILSRLGCVYHGIDISPLAVERTRAALIGYSNASAQRLDMVREQVSGVYDAALDVMGFHMLILDEDRRRYLQNAFDCIKPGAPMLFFREGHRAEEPEIEVTSMEQWLAVTGDDYQTPHKRTGMNGLKEVEVMLPLVPGRSRTKGGYQFEMRLIGFEIEQIIDMDTNRQCPHSVSIYARKPAL